MRILIPIFLFFILASHLSAKDLGVMGDIYPIEEPDFLEFLQSRAAVIEKNGGLQQLQNKMQQDAVQYRDRPKPVSGIQTTHDNKSWDFDPSIVLDHDVLTPEGKVIAVAGTHVNPLVYISLKKTLIFYDADDEAQVKWAVAQDIQRKGQDKLILVNGRLLSEEKRFGKPIYFDQKGLLTTRFSIKHVPATVSQNGLLLHISEITP